MPWGLTEIYVVLPAYVLVLSRVAGLMLAAPFFSGAILPTRLKVLLAASIALAVFPLTISRLTVPVTLMSAAAGLIGELAVGLLLGMGVSLVLMGVQLGIQLTSQQAGMALGEVFNPMLESNLPVVAELYYFVSMVIFLAVGGHRALVRTLLDSFEAVPPLGFVVSEGVVALLTDLMMVSFTLAIRVGGPMIIALLLGLMTLGFLSRTMPQLNILTIGFPIKIALALLVMALTIMWLEPLLLQGLSLAVDAVREGMGMEGLY